MSKSVIVNTGPLLALDTCHRLDLLQVLYKRVIIPQAVVQEYEQVKSKSAVSGSSLFPKWIEILIPQQPPSVMLRAYLDDGEAAVITLAVEL